jgi:hypothetical protein
MIDFAIAQKLVGSLCENHSFSEAHSLPSHAQAEELIHDAGLGVIYFPYASTKKINKHTKWNMMLGVVDADRNSGFVELDKDPIYCFTQCNPMTDYAGDLMSINLRSLWWAVPGFFGEITRLLDCSLEEYEKTQLGRSHWGQLKRSDLKKSFYSSWTKIKAVDRDTFLSPDRLRFTTAPIILKGE